MHTTNNLRGVDLNLLVVLEALLAEQHVSRAAVRLNMSQPAVSHALARLRQLFDDPLLIRHGGGLTASAMAQSLRPELTATLDGVRRLIRPEPFEPERARQTFRLAMSDYGSQVVLPALTRALRREAPGIQIRVVHLSREATLRALQEAEVDVALGVFADAPAPIRQQALFSETFACLADRSHMPPAGGLSLSEYLQHPHLLVGMPPDAGSEVDRALAALGHRRNVAISVPHWSTAADLVIGTDLVLTVSSRTLRPYRTRGDLAVFEPPFPVAAFDFSQAWHERHSADPAHEWLRQKIASVTQA